MNILTYLDKILWQNFLIYFLLFVGIFLTVRLKGMQFRYLPYALRLAFSRHDNQAQGDISQFQSLMTALAATIGIGSIAGMATAVVGGGFGAIFWMWVVAFIGMATKYAEAILAVKYRSLDKREQMCGGPMYYIEKGLRWKWLAIFFSLFGVFATFGGGNLIQSQSISDAMQDLFHFPSLGTGILLTLLSGCVIIGGIKSLGKINAFLVPIMALFYVLGGLVILFMRCDHIIPTFSLIFKEAFTGRAMAGGFLGSGMMMALQMGIARGISSNEAGLGSSPIAAAAAKTDVPGRQALISMSGVFLSSFIVCTITVLVLGVTSGNGTWERNGIALNGAPLVMHAFQSVLPGGNFIVATGLVLFGFSTILGWSYYGEKCFEYLFGERYIFFYRMVFLSFVFLGSLLTVDVVWPFADIMNGLMALPNLLALLFLSGVVSTENKMFFALVKREKRREKSPLSS
ncbi:MAG: sodium:alanine symporter family protein [Parachlamydiales bacterium]|nr:sodium:alanine symporter family protein [Parachlamydiales bacterium]